MPELPPQTAHDHVFLGADHQRNERRVWLVIALTAAMMVVEIVLGTLYGSMAVVADGWHMSTHAGAMAIAAFAYSYARRNNADPRFSFGTGKLGDLAGFASAVILGLVALLIGWESVQRFSSPVPISFGPAIVVAIAGLAVNLVSAVILGGVHGHGHSHSHAGHHSHGEHHHDHHDHGVSSSADNNLRAAYLHVLADALTSVMAIVALVAGSRYGWLWLDPAIGIVGALVIARWSWSLIRQTGFVLLDAMEPDEKLPAEIRAAIETPGERITDLHIWQVGPGHRAAIVAVETANPRAPDYYKSKLAALHALSHITVEVNGLKPAS